MSGDGVSMLKRLRWRRQRPQLLRAYLDSHDVRKLNLGAGTNPLPGWLNTDLRPGRPGVVFLDVRRPFPLPDACVRFVYCEHLIEHLALDEAGFCLREAHRVLVPDGRIRIATPSLERLALLFAAETSAEQRAYIEWAMDRFMPEIGVNAPGFVLNHFFRSWGHRFIHDPRTLSYLLERAGFDAITELPTGVSASLELAGLEAHARVIGEEADRFETFVLEARRRAS